MKRKKSGPGITLRLVLAAFVMCLVTAAGAYLACFMWYSERAAEDAGRAGQRAAQAVAGKLTSAELTGGDANGYAQTLVDETQGLFGASRVYIFRPNRDGGVSVSFDSAGGEGDMPDLKEFDAGDILDGRIVESAREGGTVTSLAPVPRGEGETVYYAAVETDISEKLRSAAGSGMLAAGITLVSLMVLTSLYFLLVRGSVGRPIRKLISAAESYTDGGNTDAFSALRFRANPELNALAEAFRLMLVELEINNLEQREKAVEEQKLHGDMTLAGSLSQAVRPRELGEEAGPFKISGAVEENGAALNGCFYDYFLLDDGRLCFAAGEASGEGMSQALFAVIGGTILKSHLRSGISLEKAMCAANRQLYEMSGGVMYLSAAVGVLDGTAGKLRLINAGQCTPLFMRFTEGRYDWLEAMPHAALGQNENVSCSAMELGPWSWSSTRVTGYFSTQAAWTGPAGRVARCSARGSSASA